jgi:hypothetical protein
MRKIPHEKSSFKRGLLRRRRKERKNKSKPGLLFYFLFFIT